VLVVGRESWSNIFKYVAHDKYVMSGNEEGPTKNKYRPVLDEKTWSEFVITMNQEYGVTPDVGKRSVNDVLRDVVEEVRKNKE